jgi:hypothetical protein
MSQTVPPSLERSLDNGDRIRVRQGQRSMPELVDRVGTIVEMFRMPLGSCLVRIDDDPDRQREWFFYSDEVVAHDT